MTEISINAVSAPQAVAELIEGFREAGLTVEMDGVLVEFDGRGKQFQDFLELQFSRSNADVTSSREFTTAPSFRTARVSIERPRNGYGRREPAKVTWSSGGQDDLASAKATSRLLDFAVRVAEQLDAWAAAGSLERLNVDEATGETTGAEA